MLENPWFYLILLGIIIIACLSAYAGRLLMLVKQQNQRQQKAEQDQKKALAGHDKKALQSVVIIVRAMEEEQCDVSEGCWRLCVLLDSLKTSSELNKEFPAIFELYGKIKHLSILDERKQLKKQERMKQDVERMKAESTLQVAIAKEVTLLHQYANERISVLTAAS